MNGTTTKSGTSSLIDAIKTRLELLAIVGVLLGGALALVDARYAAATDVGQLISSLNAARMERLEYEIKQCERRITRVMLIPEDQRTPWDIQDLNDAEDEKEFLLRQLARLEGEDD